MCVSGYLFPYTLNTLPDCSAIWIHPLDHCGASECYQAPYVAAMFSVGSLRVVVTDPSNSKLFSSLFFTETRMLQSRW